MTVFKTIEACDLELVSWTETNYGNMDRFPAQAARVSFNNDLSDRTEEEDKKLISYLAKHNHMTPFEYQHATVMIECPLFIRSQIHRHRTFSYNEISRRYTSDAIEFWIPTTLRKQAEKNKQGSDGIFAYDEYQGFIQGYKDRCERALRDYEFYIHLGVAREQARAELPQSILTRFYMGGNLRNWAHFLKLRMDSHAQSEVQCIASRVYQKLYDLWPNSLRELMK